MKKAGDLMKEMGFNPQASDAAKEAFMKYLIKQSTGVNVQTPSERQEIQRHPEKIVNFTSKQLSFDFTQDEGNTEESHSPEYRKKA